MYYELFDSVTPGTGNVTERVEYYYGHDAPPAEASNGTEAGSPTLIVRKLIDAQTHLPTAYLGTSLAYNHQGEVAMMIERTWSEAVGGGPDCESETLGRGIEFLGNGRTRYGVRQRQFVEDPYGWWYWSIVEGATVWSDYDGDEVYGDYTVTVTKTWDEQEQVWVYGPPEHGDDTLLAEYEYDALGRRIHTIEYIDAESGDPLGTPRKTRHVYVGIETVEEYYVEVATEWPYPQTATLAREFLWGDSGRFPELLAMLTHDGAGNCVPSEPGGACVFHYLHDALGSVVGLTDSAGVFVERYTYDPYGRTYVEASDGQGGWTGGSFSVFGNPFAWTGQRYEPVTGLYSFLFRTYSPSLGRWLQRDPVQYVDGPNLYAYVMDNPFAWLDPWGWDSVGVSDCGDKGDQGDGDGRDVGPEEFDKICEKSKTGTGKNNDAAARDYDHYICARSLDELYEKLKELKDKGIDITEVHIFDHGHQAGQELGDHWLDPEKDPEGNDDRDILGKIGELISPGGYIEYEGCQVGLGERGERFLEALAEATGHTAVGWTGNTINGGEARPDTGLHHDHKGSKVEKQPPSKSSTKPSGGRPTTRPVNRRGPRVTLGPFY